MGKKGKRQQPATLERSRFHVPGFPLVAETSIARFAPGTVNPLGIKYRLQLHREDTGETLVRYDVHHGKSHHRHFLATETPYEWRGVEQLFADFRSDIERIKTMISEERR